jgi:RimJ/RimL family protein N-acetyltransferase
MFSSEKIINIVKEQLAMECNCLPEDFDKRENIISLPVLQENRRRFADNPFFFKMASMGGNAVISADKRLHDWLAVFTGGQTGHGLFEHTKLREIDKVLEGYNRELFQTHHMFLPLGPSMAQRTDIEVRWFEQDDIQPFYGDKKFPNAFCEQFTPERPDMLAVAAMVDGKIAGIAGASADTPQLWQIGIDIKDEYRGRGMGTHLVLLLKKEIIAWGRIPYYGTSLSNIHSWKIALNCGFRPAWIEVETKEG